MFRSKSIDDFEEAEPRWASERTNVGGMPTAGAWPIEYFDSQEYWLVLRQQEKEEQRRDVPVPPPTPILSPVAPSSHLNRLHRHRKQSPSNEPLPGASLNCKCFPRHFRFGYCTRIQIDSTALHQADGHDLTKDRTQHWLCQRLRAATVQQCQRLGLSYHLAKNRQELLRKERSRIIHTPLDPLQR